MHILRVNAPAEGRGNWIELMSMFTHQASPGHCGLRPQNCTRPVIDVVRVKMMAFHADCGERRHEASMNVTGRAVCNNSAVRVVRVEDCLSKPIPDIDTHDLTAR